MHETTHLYAMLLLLMLSSGCSVDRLIKIIAFQRQNNHASAENKDWHWKVNEMKINANHPLGSFVSRIRFACWRLRFINEIIKGSWKDFLKVYILSKSNKNGKKKNRRRANTKKKGKGFHSSRHEMEKNGGKRGNYDLNKLFQLFRFAAGSFLLSFVKKRRRKQAKQNLPFCLPSSASQDDHQVAQLETEKLPFISSWNGIFRYGASPHPPKTSRYGQVCVHRFSCRIPLGINNFSNIVCLCCFFDSRNSHFPQ